MRALASECAGSGACEVFHGDLLAELWHAGKFRAVVVILVAKRLCHAGTLLR